MLIYFFPESEMDPFAIVYKINNYVLHKINKSMLYKTNNKYIATYKWNLCKNICVPQMYLDD